MTLHPLQYKLQHSQHLCVNVALGLAVVVWEKLHHGHQAMDWKSVEALTSGPNTQPHLY